MSDRLPELQRQRALVAEQLSWLDREIAAEKARSQPVVPAAAPTAAPAVPVAPVLASPLLQVPVGISPADSDAIMAQYRSDPGTLKQEVRKGCFLYFALAFAAFGAVVLWLYLRTTNRH